MVVDKPSARIARMLANERDSDDSIGAAFPRLCTTEVRLESHVLPATAEEIERRAKTEHGSLRLVAERTKVVFLFLHC